MRFLAIALIPLVLGACSTTRPPDPIVRTVRVEVPVVVPCVTHPVAKPIWAVDFLPLGATVDRQMRALRAERLQRIAYEIKLEAELANCTARQNVD